MHQQLTFLHQMKHCQRCCNTQVMQMEGTPWHSISHTTLCGCCTACLVRAQRPLRKSSIRRALRTSSNISCRRASRKATSKPGYTTLFGYPIAGARMFCSAGTPSAVTARGRGCMRCAAGAVRALLSPVPRLPRGHRDSARRPDSLSAACAQCHMRIVGLTIFEGSFFGGWHTHETSERTPACKEAAHCHITHRYA